MSKQVWGIFTGVICLLGGVVFLPYQFQTPSPEVFYDVSGKVLVGHKQEQRQSLDEVPQRLIDLVVGVEDKRFRSHPGIDGRSIARVVWLYLQGVRPIQGASTIDQQLIKLDRAQFVRGWGAKIIENRRAVRLQFQLSKEEILLRYLNSIPFSHGIIGRKSACQSYRGKSCYYLSDEQLVVTLTSAQLGANPYRELDWKNIVARAQMYARVRPDLFTESLVIDDTLADELQSFPAPLDPRVQPMIQASDGSGRTMYDLALSSRLDSLLELTKGQREQYAIGDCCVVVLNGSGDLLSMNMCRARDDSAGGKVNNCLVPRQTGSAIKPFLYLYAFKQLGLTSKDLVVDEPVQFDLGGGNLYDPKNFDLDYHGEVTYAYALGNSLNVPAVKTLYQVGVPPFLDFLKQQLQRVTPEIPLNPKTADEVGLSLALGTYEMSPFQFAQLWRILLPSQTPSGYEQQGRDVVDVLSNPTNKIVSFGQDNFLSPRGWAVKTGTSRKFVDGWICGSAPFVPLKRVETSSPTLQIPPSPPLPRGGGGRIVCLWLGNQTNEPMLGASSEVGSYLWSLIVQTIEM